MKRRRAGKERVGVFFCCVLRYDRLGAKEERAESRIGIILREGVLRRR